MKPAIHPTYNSQLVVTCACGNSFTTGSTQKEIKVDICSACHPFYTGEARFVDTQGRVEKFQLKMKAAAANPRAKKAKSFQQDVFVAPKSLKDMLSTAKK